MLSAVMYEFIAPVTDQTATTKPITVITMLPPGWEPARWREFSSSVVTWLGTTPFRLSMKLVIIAGLATRVKRPTATMITAGMAKNVLYASAEASIMQLSDMNCLPARITIAL